MMKLPRPTAAVSKEEAAAILVEHAKAIRALGKRAVRDVIEIGERLIASKHLCGHGNWIPWLDREFRWTEQTALNFMRVAELSKSKKFLDLEIPISGLFLLAAPSTPEPAKIEIIERAKVGEALPVAEVKKVIDKHKPARRKGQKKKPPKGVTKPSLPPMPSPRDDIGPHSSSEAARLRARNEELENENARLRREKLALRREVEKLKQQLANATGKAAPAAEPKGGFEKPPPVTAAAPGLFAHYKNVRKK